MKNLLRPVRELALKTLAYKRGLPRTLNGVRFRVDPTVRVTFVEDYDAPVAAFLKRRVTVGCEVWNVGANVGVYALQLAHWVGPQGIVLAFEPNASTARFLRRNLELNDFKKRVEVLEMAVGDTEGTVDFFASGTDGMSRAGHANPLLPHTTRTRVPVTTLDATAAQVNRKPAWVIMDIEGWEIAALRGARSLLRSGQTGFVVELHPDAWAWSGHTRVDLEKLLEESALEAVPLVGQSDPLGSLGQVFLRRSAGR